jgi:hypothetical protein
MSRRFRRIVAAAALLATAELAAAHHAFSPVFDGSKTLTIEGVVREFKFVNPHATLTMDVTDESGNVVRWSVEMAGRLNLVVAGWTVDSISPGDHVAVTGNPARSNDPELYLKRLVFADGRELLTPGQEVSNAVEEERRKRREESGK